MTCIESGTDGRGVPISTVRCPAHVGLSAPALLGTVLSENRRKNNIERYLHDNFPATYTAQADGTKVTNDGAFVWSFDANRVLTVTCKDLNAVQRAQLKAYCDTQFGVGKVAVGA